MSLTSQPQQPGYPAVQPTGQRVGYQPAADSLADILERVLDKGIVIAGDIMVNVLDIELLTLKVRLLVASVDTAREMGIDWWEHDPFLTGGARSRDGERELADRVRQLERQLADRGARDEPSSPDGGRNGTDRGAGR